MFDQPASFATVPRTVRQRNFTRRRADMWVLGLQNGADRTKNREVQAETQFLFFRRKLNGLRRVSTVYDAVSLHRQR
jgi:hypothetical protein